LLFLICCLALNAQVNIVDKKNVYEAWIKLANNSEVSRGIIYEISDSSIFLLHLCKLTGSWNFGTIT
jgi:hypothetical protein